MAERLDTTPTAEQELREQVLTDADWPRPRTHGDQMTAFATLVGNGLVLLARRIDAGVDADVRAVVRDELASVGGGLLADYGSTSPATDVGLEDAQRIQDRSLGTLGGRLVRLGDGES